MTGPDAMSMTAMRGEDRSNVLRLYDTESDFSRYAKIRKNDCPERRTKRPESSEQGRLMTNATHGSRAHGSRADLEA